MGVTRPTGWRDIYQNPEDYKRMQSGFWSHHYDMETQTTTWTCDKRKLHEKVAMLMQNSEFRHGMTQHGPTRALDIMFGKGTGDAYAHSGKGNFIHMTAADELLSNYARVREPLKNDMRDAMAYYYNTGTAATTSTTSISGSTFNSFSSVGVRAIEDDFQRSVKKKSDSFKFKKRLVRTLPFVHGGDSLLATLQREFDFWAGDTRKQLFG